jgi:peptidoglycan DL-endopeptidase CwlO
MRKRIFKGVAAVLLSSTLTVSTVFAVFADDVDKLKQQKQQTEQELDDLQNQWAYLLQQMDDLELKMAKKSDEIDAANVKLEEAEKVQAAQYEDMKLRIKYMYEDQSVSLAEVFLTSSDMSTMLNKAVYMQEVYNYDRNKLDEMANTAQEIQNLKTGLENDKKELDEAQAQLTEKQALLYSTIQETQAKADDVSSQLESAVKKAAEVAARKEQERLAAAAVSIQQNIAPPAKGDSSVANGVVSLAYSLLGVPYVSGGSSPSGFDCSGFTSYLFRQYGISISRSSSAQAYGGTAVNGLANAQPGDVICYPGHVGLYVGGGQMIHANVPGGSVRLVGVNSIGMSVIAIRRYW